MRILFTGGGTGGHIYPIIAVAEQLDATAKRSGFLPEFHYIGVPAAFEQLLSANGIAVHRIASAKMRRGNPLRNVMDMPFFFIGLLQALWRVFWIMPDVVFSKGGPGALPVVLACAFYRIPVVIHESDSVAGLTNRISARYADRIGISFASAEASFLEPIEKEAVREAMEKKIALVGNPIRSLFFAGDKALSRETAKRTLGFAADKPLIVIMGGSQGSVRINEFFVPIVEELLGAGYQIMHQTGTANFDTVVRETDPMMRKYSAEFRSAYKVVPYFTESIRDIYQASDLIISRAGSGSIFEIAATGRASVLIPLPEAAFDHQRKNAFEYAQAGAAIMIEEANLTKNLFMTQLTKCMGDRSMREAMEAAAKAFARPDAAVVLASEILTLAQR